jgi:hypothetical protein
LTSCGRSSESAETKSEDSYEGAAKALGVGVGTVKTFIYRLRKRYLAVVREEVARTVSDPAEIQAEIRALCDALIAAEGRQKTLRNSESEPGTRRGLVEQEARMCPVWAMNWS